MRLQSDDTKFITQLGETAANVALRNFEWRFITFVFFNTTLINGVEIFLSAYNKSVIVGKGTFYPRFTDKTNQFVLFVDNIRGLQTTLEWMEAHQFYNTGRYILVCQSLISQDCDESQAMQILWHHGVINVVFLKKENNVTAYTYFPMNDSSCNVNVPVKLNITNIANLFERKLKNLNKCKIIVSTFPQKPYMKFINGKTKGADGDLLTVLGEGLNASIEVITPLIGHGWGKLEDNGSWTGSLGDVYYGIANFSMTSAALTITRFRYFQISSAYYSASIAWVVHPAVLKPASLKLLHPFQPTVQLAIAISFLSVVLCSLIAKTRFWSTFSKTIKLTKPRSSIIFYSWIICMGLPITRLPTKAALVYITMFWMLYCFLMRTLYQACLINALQGNYYYYDEFQSINDAVKANYPFGGGVALKDYYINEPVVYNKWIKVDTNDIAPRLMNISNGMKFVLAMNMDTATVVKKDKRLPLYIMPEKAVVSPTVVFFKKYSPLEHSVSYILSRLSESGFCDKFYKNYAVSKKAEDAASNQPIAIKHYTGCYTVLVCGWITSSVIFIIELYCGKIKAPRRPLTRARHNRYCTCIIKIT